MKKKHLREFLGHGENFCLNDAEDVCFVSKVMTPGTDVLALG